MQQVNYRLAFKDFFQMHTFSILLNIIIIIEYPDNIFSFLCDFYCKIED